MLNMKNGHGYVFLSVQSITYNSVIKIIGFWKINFKLALEHRGNEYAHFSIFWKLA